MWLQSHNGAPTIVLRMEAVMEASGTLLGSISDFCRRTGMAESTFGRRAVNDGKFVARLRDGARVTPETLQRVNQFINKHGLASAGDSPPELLALIRASAVQPAAAPAREPLAPEKNFRFFDNRQKYLLFVNTCSEKDVVARRVGLELGHIHPQPPAVRLFDAGMGDGTVLARVMREMHRRFPTVPFYIVGKEISLEDVRLSLRKMVDRFYEHPATVVVYRDDYRFLLDEVIPKRGQGRADYDMVIASQPYRARAPLEFKAQKVIA